MLTENKSSVDPGGAVAAGTAATSAAGVLPLLQAVITHFVSAATLAAAAALRCLLLVGFFCSVCRCWHRLQRSVIPS
jgi:fucose permease